MSVLCAAASHALLLLNSNLAEPTPALSLVFLPPGCYLVTPLPVTTQTGMSWRLFTPKGALRVSNLTNHTFLVECFANEHSDPVEEHTLQANAYLNLGFPQGCDRRQMRIRLSRTDGKPLRATAVFNWTEDALYQMKVDEDCVRIERHMGGTVRVPYMFKFKADAEQSVVDSADTRS